MSESQFLADNLRPGETYIGLLAGAGGTPSHHLFLLPVATEKANWSDAVTWAESVGGELPTRREQELMYSNFKDQFEPSWYWSSERREANADYVWDRNFGSGAEGYTHKAFAGRARAIRRLPI